MVCYGTAARLKHWHRYKSEWVLFIAPDILLLSYSELVLPNRCVRVGETSMSEAGFEPAFPASERPQTHVLDRAATGIFWHDGTTVIRYTV